MKRRELELEVELIQSQMTQKLTLRAEVCAHAEPPFSRLIIRPLGPTLLATGSLAALRAMYLKGYWLWFCVLFDIYYVLAFR